MTLIDRSYQIGTYKCGFLFALVSSSENIEAFAYTFAGTLVDIHSPKINVNTAGAPIWTKKNSIYSCIFQNPDIFFQFEI